MRKKWINKAASHKEAEDFDLEYYSSMSYKQRLEILQFLRETFFKIRGEHVRRKRLRRTIKIIKQA